MKEKLPPIYTKAFGWVEQRGQREPAQLNCEGACGKLTLHTFRYSTSSVLELDQWTSGADAATI